MMIALFIYDIIAEIHEHGPIRRSIRVYVSGLNLYCWNDVNFWDPEQGVTGNTAGQYPTTKSIVGGLEFTF